ncbi:MAG: hypothetical protein AAF389_04625 [Gemmatimonadota bacterium]
MKRCGGRVGSVFLTALLAAGIGASHPNALAGQDVLARAGNEGTIIGAVVGVTRTDGLWKPSSTSDPVLGGMVGGYVLAATPAPWFSILAEVTFLQRNSNVVGTNQGQPLQGGLRTDYLSVLIAPRFTREVGPVRIHLAGGPTIDQVIRARLDPTLSPVLREVESVFGASLALGVGVTLADRYRVDVEGRAFEGLGDAHSGDFLQMRNRTFGLVTRVGIPIPDSWRGS